ncbi:hypothetical protein F5887DRAFT_1197179 [Amanita rubescens]|nr:hypothetical protein F5887DRAFT_1197179 [Amanita rubescens]
MDAVHTSEAQYLSPLRLMGSLQSPNTATLTQSDSIDYPSPIGNVPSEVLSHIFVLCSCDYPVPLLYHQWEVPHQVTISHVCSRWRQVALSTGVLWSNVRISKFDSDYARCRFLYQTWVGRACDYPLTLTLTFSGPLTDLYNVFLDLVVPFRIKALHMTLPSDKFFDLPSFDVEEFGIDVTNFLMEGDLSPLMERARRICIWTLGPRSVRSQFGERIKALSLSWHQLRSFECHSNLVSLSTWLDILHQAQTLQSLERCRLTISEVGSGPLVGVCMPNLRWFALSLLGPIHPDSAIPLIVAPNITTLGITSPGNWSSNTYDVIAKHYKLHQLQHFWIHAAQFPLRISQVLADAPMIDNLKVLGKPVLDAETRKDIASGRLGRYLTSLHINGCFDSAGEWLDMIESRQKNVNLMITHVSNWRELFTGIKSVEF